MVKEIVTWCSPCFAEGEKESATSVVIALDNHKPKVVDVCERHEKELVEPLRLLLADHGARVDVPAAAMPSTPSGRFPNGERVDCPIDDCGRSYRNNQSLGKHLRSVHNTSLTDAMEGHTDTLGDESSLRFQCPERDCSRGFDSAQGLGSHRSRAHGYVSPNKEAIRQRTQKAAERRATAS